MVPKGIKIFNLGSSHGLCSFDYTEIKEKYKIEGYNLGWHSQTLYYDKIMLENFYSNIDKDAICFIVLSYFSFSGKERWLKEDLKRYYKILSLKYFSGEEKLNGFIFKYLPIIWSIRKKIIKKFFTKNLSIDERIKGHAKKLKSIKNREYNVNLLKEIIEKCEEKNMKIIFLTSPFTEYYNSFFDKEILKKNFYDIIDIFIKKYNINYIDFSHNYNIFNKNEYFNDFDHLSKEGSKVFMKELIKKLKEENVDLSKI